MGLSSAQDMVFWSKKLHGRGGNRMALQWHLQSNHYPPINLMFMPAAETAIRAGKHGNWSKKIKLPNGKILTAGQICQELHLDSFL